MFTVPRVRISRKRLLQAGYETLVTRTAGNPGGERHQPARLSMGKRRNSKTAQSF